MRRKSGATSPDRGTRKLVLAVTVSESVTLLRGQIRYGRARGYTVYVISGPGSTARSICDDEGATHVEINMERDIAPLRDLRSLWKIYKALRRIRPTVVNAGTPKAGFLVVLAATLARVRCRIYTLRGLRYQTTTGIKRKVLMLVEWLTCRLASSVICISPSLQSQAIADGVLQAQKSVVLGKGSSNGVDTTIFDRGPITVSEADRIRARLGIERGQIVIGFVGRIVKDKGIEELIAAWQQLRKRFDHLHMIVIGAFENKDELTDACKSALAEDERINVVGYVHSRDQLAAYYATMDVLVLPTYREGFGNVLVEAAAVGIPVVASRVAGCVDAVEDGVTGILVEPGDVAQLVNALCLYITDRGMREKHGQAGYRRARAYFRQELIWEALYDYYESLVGRPGKCINTQ